MRFSIRKLIVCGLIPLTAPTAFATAWYVNGVTGADTNNCLSATTACKSIGHAIALAASGDTVVVAAAIYKENLNIGINLKLIGAGPTTTIIDGGGTGRVINIDSTSANVQVSRFTIRNGRSYFGGGVANSGTLLINNCTISGNTARGGGSAGLGGGVGNANKVTISNSTLTGNSVSGPFGAGFGGGVGNVGTAVISNSTFNGNFASAYGGAVYTQGPSKVTISSSTISSNSASKGGGAFIYGGTMILQNTILASNTAQNCYGYAPMTSDGYNLSSDTSCNFSGSGDKNNIDPMLGALKNNGGPTQTMALPSGSPAIDAGNPAGCMDGLGHLLKTDQRGRPRPDKEDISGCDIGAYESQID